MKRMVVLLLLLQFIVIAPRPVYAYGGVDAAGDLYRLFSWLNRRPMLRNGASRGAVGQGVDAITPDGRKLRLHNAAVISGPRSKAVKVEKK